MLVRGRCESLACYMLTELAHDRFVAPRLGQLLTNDVRQVVRKASAIAWKPRISCRSLSSSAGHPYLNRATRSSGILITKPTSTGAPS